MFVDDHWCPAFAAWTTAVLRGRVSIDDAVDALTHDVDDAAVSGLPDEPDAVQLSWAMGNFRRQGITGLCSAWAAPGNTGRLPGPPDFNARAVSRGGAVVSVDGAALGVLADVTTVGSDDDHLVRVQWQVERVQRFAQPFVVSLPEAERLMIEALHQGLSALERLDVAQWRDEVLDVMKAWNDDDALIAPPGLPDRAYRVMAQTQRLLTVLELATEDDGGALSTGEAAARKAVLAPLIPAVRDASAAAWNSGLTTSKVAQ